MPDFSPSFIQRDPVTGKTYYVFPGGLIIPATVDHTVVNGVLAAGAASSISFQDQNPAHTSSYGKTLGYLTAFPAALNTMASLLAMGWGSGARLQVGATDDTTGSNQLDAVLAFATSPIGDGGNASIDASVGNVSKKILDSNGGSDFAQRSQFQLISNFTAGPLPVSGNFNVPIAGDYWFIGVGSCYVDVAQVGAIGFGIDTTGSQGQSKAYFNEAASHKVLLPAFWQVNGLAAGSHTFNVHVDSASTHTDVNDFFNIFMLPAP